MGIFRLVLAVWCIAEYIRLGYVTKDVIFPSNRVGRSKRHYMQPLQQPSHYPGQRLVLRLKCIQSTRRQTRVIVLNSPIIVVSPIRIRPCSDMRVKIQSSRELKETCQILAAIGICLDSDWGRDGPS